MERLLQLQEQVAGSKAGPTENDNSPGPADEQAGAEDDAPPAGAGTAEDDAGTTADAGQNDLSKSEPGGEEAEGEAGAETATELPAELAELPDDVRGELLALAKEVAEGKTSFRDLKRGHKLIGKHAAELERLETENAELKRQVSATETQPAANNGAVVKLKTVAEVQKRTAQLEAVMDWCEDNPQGGEFNGQQFNADDVREARRAARAELRQLPVRERELQGQSQFAQRQTLAKAEAVKLFPHLADPDHAETQAVTKLLAASPWLKDVFLSPEVAALTYLRGQSAVKADLERAKAKAGSAGERNLKVAATGVQKGRPASGGTAAGGKPAGGPTVKAARERIAKEGSVGALAELMGAASVG